MIWNSKEARFSWGFIVLAVFSTLYLVGFDLIWRHVKLGFVELAAFGAVGWVVGAIAIWYFSRKSSRI